MRTRGVAGTGGQRELEDLVAEVMSQPLDRARPLWEIVLVNGLAGRRQAVVIKLHHAIADGIGALALAEKLFDQTDRPAIGGWRPAPEPQGVHLFSTTLAEQITAPWRGLYGAARRAANDPRRTIRQTQRTLNGIWQLARAGSATPTRVNRTVKGARSVALAEIALDPVRTARRRHGGTDNDVVLAAVSAALYEWFGDEAPESVRTMVPVSTRRGSKLAPGTWTATLDVDLPLGPMSPADLLHAVTATTQRAKRSDQALGSQLVMEAVGTWTPPFVHARFARFAYRGKWFNLIVSTVPGPRSARHLAGMLVSAAYPIIPLAEEVGLTVAALRWNDRLTFGLTADPTQVDDVPKLGAAMVTFIHDLASSGA